MVYGVRPDRPERGLRFFLGAKLLTHLANLLYGAGIHDEATCYKVFRRSLISQINLECRRFEFCPEVTAKLCRMGEKIAEVPISLCSAFGRRRQKDSPLGRLAGHLDAVALPLRPQLAMDKRSLKTNLGSHFR